MEHLVYLVCPMLGRSYDAVWGWQKHVIDSLPPHIKAIPTLAGDDIVGVDALAAEYTDSLMNNPKAIAARAFFNVQRCDAILANFIVEGDVQCKSGGALAELAYAKCWQKPVVAVMDKGNVHDSWEVTETAMRIVDELEKGIAVVRAILTP